MGVCPCSKSVITRPGVPEVENWRECLVEEGEEGMDRGQR